jgi:hypothetical protein
MDVHRRWKATPRLQSGRYCSGYSARQAKPCQPMTGEKGHHSSAQADKNPAATGFWAAAVTRLLSLYVERVLL